MTIVPGGPIRDSVLSVSFENKICYSLFHPHANKNRKAALNTNGPTVTLNFDLKCQNLFWSQNVEVLMSSYYVRQYAYINI